MTSIMKTVWKGIELKTTDDIYYSYVKIGTVYSEEEGKTLTAYAKIIIPKYLVDKNKFFYLGPIQYNVYGEFTKEDVSFEKEAYSSGSGNYFYVDVTATKIGRIEIDHYVKKR